jgi:glycosyltransferase involved in cell wall biosynthesis
MTSKKVLHVVNISFVIPYYIGGQFDYFSARGIQFYVACQPSAHLEEYSRQKNFTAFPLNVLRSINPVEDLRAIYRLRQYIKKEGIDVVIGHTPKGGLIAMIAAFSCGIKQRIYFRHGLMYETSKGLKRHLLKSIEKLSGYLASKVVCVSPSVLQVSNQEKLSPLKKNILLNKGTCNGIDALNAFWTGSLNRTEVDHLKAKYGITPLDRVVGYVGRLVNDKGINELIAAWKLLLENNSNCKLLLVGPFEERDALPPHIKDYILNTSSIIYTGLIHDTPIHYSLMDMFILPSYREGFPTVVLEASAMELPVLTTRATGCIDSIIENETGMFVDLTPEDIVIHIQAYLDDPALRHKHGKNGRLYVLENFEQSSIWQEIGEHVLEIKD